MAPIATRVNTKLMAHKLLCASHSLSSTTLSLLHLYSSFPLLVHTQQTLVLKLCLCCFFYLESLPQCICIHCCGCCITPLRSLFRNGGVSPLPLKVLSAGGSQLSAPFGSCLSQRELPLPRPYFIFGAVCM